MNKNSITPLYQQLADDIKQQILEGRLKENDKLMTEQEFSQTYDVSRITVRKAIEILADEGYVTKHQGIGTFVAAKKLNRVMNKLLSFTEMCENDGKTASTEMVSLEWTLASVSGSPEGFAVSSRTKYPEESVEFLKWFLGPEVGAAQAEEVGWFNASRGVDAGLKDPSLVDAYKAISSAKEMGPWFDSSLYSTLCDTYLTAISNVTNGDVTPAEAMKKVQATAKEAQSLVH